MEEELKDLKKNYRKVKILFQRDVNLEQVPALIKLKSEELNQILNSIKDNIILLPLIEMKVDLDFILKRIKEVRRTL